MDSRRAILNKVRNNKPTLETKIDLSPFFVDNGEDMIQRFSAGLEDNGGTIRVVEKDENLENLLVNEIMGNAYVDFSGVVDKGVGFFDCDDLNSLAKIKTAIFKVDLGVAENGAIWLADEHINSLRMLPFVVERGIFILPKTNIVATMHHAYSQLNQIKTGFGTFIAGPSKTGDIEQNLVVGAHGPLSHTVILT